MTFNALYRFVLGATVVFLLWPFSLRAQAEKFWFDDVSTASGITATNVFGPIGHKNWLSESTGNGLALIDYDNDGWTDVFLVNGTRYETAAGLTTSHLYHNNHDGTFTDVSKGSGLDSPGWGQGVCAGDYDNDGFVDLFVTYNGTSRLFRNLGNGHFEDVTALTKLPTDARWATGCTFVDFDRDGWLDLFVTHYANFDRSHTVRGGDPQGCTWRDLHVFCGPRGIEPEKSQMFRNRGDGTFIDVSDSSGVSLAPPLYGLGVVSLDYDNDGWPDLYVACDSVASQLFHNKRNGTFEEVGVSAGVAMSDDGNEQAGMGVTAGDYDNDGNMDLFKTNFSNDLPNLYHNDGNGVFTDRIYASGNAFSKTLLGWGAVFADFENDGWLDIFQVNGHVYYEVTPGGQNTSFRELSILYHNMGNGKFSNISKQAGPALDIARPARGLAVGDLNNDGILDVVINNLNEPPTVLMGRLSAPRHWVALRLQGTRSNRSAIGARVKLTAFGKSQYREVQSSTGFLSQSELRLHFGLGTTSRIDEIEIHWPAGEMQVLHDVGVDKTIDVTEPNR